MKYKYVDPNKYFFEKKKLLIEKYPILKGISDFIVEQGLNWSFNHQMLDDRFLEKIEKRFVDESIEKGLEYICNERLFSVSVSDVYMYFPMAEANKQTEEVFREMLPLVHCYFGPHSLVTMFNFIDFYFGGQKEEAEKKLQRAELILDFVNPNWQIEKLFSGKDDMEELIFTSIGNFVNDALKKKQVWEKLYKHIQSIKNTYKKDLAKNG